MTAPETTPKNHLEPSEPASSRARLWLAAVIPLLLLGALLFWITQSATTRALNGGAPPVEKLVIERVTLSPDNIKLLVLNDGIDPVSIAQVTVDDAFWDFVQTPSGPLRHLRRVELSIPYPWVLEEAHELRLLSATGVTFEHTIEVALPTPRPDLRFFLIFALIGLYVGVLPVAVGLLWYPVLSRVGQKTLDFVIALTLGLLLFLFVDSVHEGLEAAGRLPDSFQGVALLMIAAVGAYLLIEALGMWLRSRRAEVDARWITAVLVAVGIGLHNFAEGLAIGAAFTLGEAALGSLLIIGFTLHNTTEGLAIVAPLADHKTALRRLIGLGLVAGAPTIPGAWLGGLNASLIWSVVFLAAGAGAIAQVVVQIIRNSSKAASFPEYLQSRPVLTGLVSGFLLMYATGLLIG